MTEQEKILKKIKKCLALSESSNENEAAAAMRQARKMMESYGLTEKQVGLTEYRNSEYDSGYRRIPRYVIMLAQLIGKAFQCSTYSQMGVIQYVGREENTEVASYCLDVLLRSLRTSRRDFLRKLPSKGRVGAPLKRQYGDAYCEGWIVALSKKVSELAEPLTNSESDRHDEYLREVKKESISEAKSTKNFALSKGAGAMKAAMSGYSDGQEVDLYVGMNQDQKAQPLPNKESSS